MYSLFEWSIFKTEAIKKSHYRFKTYPYPNILISLANWTIYVSKKGGKLILPPSTFQSGGGG